MTPAAAAKCAAASASVVLPAPGSPTSSIAPPRPDATCRTGRADGPVLRRGRPGAGRMVPRLAAQRRGGPRWSRRGGHGWGCRHRGRVRLPAERGVLGEDGGFEPAQPGPGFQAEFAGQDGAAPLVGAQCVGLPPAAVGRDDQLPPAPLPQRTRLDHRLQFGHGLGVPSQRQPGVDPVFAGKVMGLGELGRHRHRPRLGGELGQRVTVPQRQRVLQAGGRGRGPAARQVVMRLPCQRLEPQRVNMVVRDPQRVARGPG